MGQVVARSASSVGQRHGGLRLTAQLTKNRIDTGFLPFIVEVAGVTAASPSPPQPSIIRFTACAPSSAMESSHQIVGRRCMNERSITATQHKSRASTGHHQRAMSTSQGQELLRRSIDPSTHHTVQHSHTHRTLPLTSHHTGSTPHDHPHLPTTNCSASHPCCTAPPTPSLYPRSLPSHFLLCVGTGPACGFSSSSSLTSPYSQML